MSDLENKRRDLLDYFVNSSRLEEITILPGDDERLLNLLSRLYEEFKGDRAIAIDLEPEDDLVQFDYFFNFMPVEDNEFDILCIFVTQPEEELETLWTMYKMWLHEGRSRAEIEALFPKDAGK